MKSQYTKIGAGLLVVAACVLVYIEIHASGSIADDANTRDYLDISTNKPFKHRLVLGDRIPIEAPSGGMTGYPAELCYWTADGQASDTPTSVVLKNLLGQKGPTFCPTCHRLVVANNPLPGDGVQPPLTESEWNAKHGIGH